MSINVVMYISIHATKKSDRMPFFKLCEENMTHKNEIINKIHAINIKYIDIMRPFLEW